MFHEDWDGEQRAPIRNAGNASRNSRNSLGKGERTSSKRVIATTSALAALLIVITFGVMVKLHSAQTATAPQTGSPNTKSAKPAERLTLPKSLRLIFDSTFSGSTLSSKVWATCFPWAKGGCTNYGNGSDPDQEWYQASQVKVQGGALHLIAQHKTAEGVARNGVKKKYYCRSGMITSYPSLRFKYGYIQIVANIPFSKGLWPALWLAAANKKWPPEIDILEHWGSLKNGRVYLHPKGGPRVGGAVSTPNLSKGWHTFTLAWTKKRLIWYYDGTQIFTATSNVPQQDMYLVANLADDSVSPGACSGTMLIKSVKVWQI